MHRHRTIGALAAALLMAAAAHLAGQPLPRSSLRFEIVFPAAAQAQPVTGRVYVLISRDAQREPRRDVSQTGIPIFGRDVERLAPGKAAIVDETDLGFPFESLRDLPAGEYYVQG